MPRYLWPGFAIRAISSFLPKALFYRAHPFRILRLVFWQRTICPAILPCRSTEADQGDGMDVYDQLCEMRAKRIRSRFVGSAGSIAFVAGTAFAGKCMIWLGMFKPGITPNEDILAYWPGFLIGGVVLGGAAAAAARIFYDFYCEPD